MKKLTDVQLKAMAYTILQLEDKIAAIRESFLLGCGWTMPDDVHLGWSKEGQDGYLTDEEAFYSELSERNWDYDERGNNE